MRPKRNSRFGLVFVLLLVPCCALWFFYRSVFQDDTILVVPIVLGLITSYLCAYALTGGKDPYNCPAASAWRRDRPREEKH